MKFGVFLPNGSNGYIPSLASPQYLPTYKHNLEITLEAERHGMDFVLSMMKFRGFGGKSGYWDSCLDSFTLMAALGAATSRIKLIPTAALLSVHPAVAARAVATINDISDGRCGLNIVTGWNKPEYVQMGLWRGDEYYDRRYEFAAEYVTLLKELWAHNNVTYKGEFFQVEDCTVLPKPNTDVTIVCAGQSPKGLEFTAQYGDYSFVMAAEKDMKSFTERMKAASAKAKRKSGTFALYNLIIAPTDAEARRIGEDIIAGADQGALDNILKSAAMDTNVGGTSARMKEGLSLSLEDGNLAFMGFPTIHGSPETVASKINDIAAATNVEGMLFSWPDFVPGVRDFGEKVMPRLTC